MMLRGRECTSGASQRHHCSGSGGARPPQAVAPHHQRRAAAAVAAATASSSSSSSSDLAAIVPTSSRHHHHHRRRRADSLVACAAAGDGGGGGGDAAKAAMLARIAAAKQYKTSGGADAGPAAGSAAAAPPAAAGDSSEADMAAARAAWEADLRAKEAAARGDGAYSALVASIEAGADTSGDSGGSRGQPARADFYTSRDAPDTATLLANSARAQGPGRGSATEVAAWMAGVVGPGPDGGNALSADGGALPEGMSMEQYALLREARARAAGADVITAAPGAVIERGVPSTVGGFASPAAAPADASTTADAAAAGAEQAEGVGEEEPYRPKVTTWGVFPRPRNVSEAYGGGRNIKPGQALETDAQRAAREAEYAAALQTYKRKAGLAELDPAELAAAEKRYAAAADLMAKGRLSDALAAFEEVRAAVPLKTRLGGQATLQAAICLDSLGDSAAAQALYRKLRGHPSGDIGKRARHLSFGFEAMDFLKTRSVSYAVGKEEYAKYFRRFADENRVYVASDEERAADAAASRTASLIAAGVVLGPVAAFAALVLAGR